MPETRRDFRLASAPRPETFEAKGTVSSSMERNAVGHVMDVLAAERPGIPAEDRHLFRNIFADPIAQDGRWGRQGFWAVVGYCFGRWRQTIQWAPLKKTCVNRQ